MLKMTISFTYVFRFEVEQIYVVASGIMWVRLELYGVELNGV